MVSANKRESILVVDDIQETLEVLKRNLSSRGYRVYTSLSVSRAMEILDSVPVDLVVTDYKLPGNNGLELIRHIRDNHKTTEAMMITGYASIEGAVEAVKTGAEEYLSKPFTDEELFSAVDRALKKQKRRRVSMSREINGQSGRFGIIGVSLPMKQIYYNIEKASSTSAAVLILGETGTGKELVARAIHYNSARAMAPFVSVNCGVIPENLMKSELFGCVGGSRPCFFKTAEGGTIFLDEIGDIGISIQSELLNVLQAREICTAGPSHPRQVDVRIISTTNRNPTGLVSRGLLKEDLYYRLNLISISVPPLRERGDDVILLANHFLEKYSREQNRDVPVFTDTALKVLKSYDWPGNVRELENQIQRLMIMNEGEQIDASDFPFCMRFSAYGGEVVHRTLEEVEQEHIRNVLASVRGNKTRAAEILGIDRKTLRNRMG